MRCELAMMVLGGVALAGAPSARAVEARATIELVQTGESAKVENPGCADGVNVSAADVILKVGSAVADEYIGAPITSTVIENLSPGNRDWLKVRLGLHDGKSTCAIQCVVLPNTQARLEACLSETGGDGLQCYKEPGDYPWGRVESFTTAVTDSGAAKVFCARGKNWSHNRNRWFVVTANW